MATLTTAVGASATLRTSGSVASSFTASDNDLNQAAANAVHCSLNYTSSQNSKAIVRFEVSADGTTWTEVAVKEPGTGELRAFEVVMKETATRGVLVPKVLDYFRAKDKGAGTLAITMVPKQVQIEESVA